MYLYFMENTKAERIQRLLEHIISSAKIEGLEDIELCATVLLGSIEKGCVDELAVKCEEFTEEKVMKLMAEELFTKDKIIDIMTKYN